MIRESDSVEELVERYPGITAFLMQKGVACVQCGEVLWSTVGDLIRSKGLDVEGLLRETNDRFTLGGS